MTEAQFESLRADLLTSLERADLFVQDCHAGADPQFRLPIRVITDYAWHSLFARNLFIVADDQDRPHARVHDPRRAGLPGRSRLVTAANSEVVIAVSFAEAAGAHRWHELRRRNQEIGLHGPQLPAAAARRVVDALLGQHRRRRGRRAVLRPLGHREDDAVERSRTASDRGRRARLERSGRLQLRGWLLRQDDQALGGGRAADLRDDPPLRDGARERGDR